MIPDTLLQSLQTTTGFDLDRFIEAHERDAPTSIRYNLQKIDLQNISFEKVLWSDHSYYLPERPNFTIDPLFHAGCYYVQEASSIFLEHVIRHLKTESNFELALDACAAPGGKSTLLLDVLDEKTILVSNEIISSRANILIDNLTKWGNKNSMVTNSDTSKFKTLVSVFDLVVIDAPCSGSGLFRKDKEAIKEWSLHAVEQCADRQEKIIENLVGTLTQNGYLVYSTCSYSEKENEAICDYILEVHGLSSIQIPFPKDWGIIEVQSNNHQAYGYRFYPNKVKGEGFFIAVFKQENGGKRIVPKQRGKRNFNTFQKAVLKDFLQLQKQEEIIIKNNFIHCLDNSHLEIAEMLSQHLHIRKLGIEIGELKGENLIPSHALAMSKLIINDSIQRLEITREMALKYLRGENILIENATNGWAIVCYLNHPLGWIKIIQNRTNNYYPKYSRILHY
jgi:16S rRNA C967 or C1407 C5-methylase (RsmB/RsmF family)/NOL1/NOP2/fmu family ribosome biogenesis protein